MSIGNPHRHYARTDSTNVRARELAAAGAPHGTVVTAAEQTHGRGRQNRSWTAPRGKALLYSAIVRPLDRSQLLALAAALAVCEAAEQIASGLRCQLKWPNDVQIADRKLAGILIEARPQAAGGDGWAVIGVGLNLAIEAGEFPPELRGAATSLGGGASAEEARVVLDAQLTRWVTKERGEVLEAWRARDALRGREVTWDGGSGVADGVDERGSLLVIAPDGRRLALGAGEVHLVGA